MAYIIAPRLKMSIATPYGIPEISSGARYPGEPNIYLSFAYDELSAEAPLRPASLKVGLSLVVQTMTFSSLMSRCMML